MSFALHSEPMVTSTRRTWLTSWPLSSLPAADGCVYPGVASEVDTLTADERAGMVAQLGTASAGGALPFVVGASADSAEATIAHIEAGAPRRCGSCKWSWLRRDWAMMVSSADRTFRRPSRLQSPIPVMMQTAPRPHPARVWHPSLWPRSRPRCPVFVWVKEGNAALRPESDAQFRRPREGRHPRGSSVGRDGRYITTSWRGDRSARCPQRN